MKNSLKSFLGLALPLFFTIFGFYEAYKVLNIPDESDLKYITCTIDYISFLNNKTVINILENPKMVFATDYITNDFLNQNELKEINKSDVYIIGYSHKLKNKNNIYSIVTLQKNDSVIFSYQDNIKKRKTEAKEGPLAATYTFMGISIFLFLILIFAPKLEKIENKWRAKLKLDIITKLKANKLDDNYYTLIYKNTFILIHYELTDKGDELKVYIPMKSDFSNQNYNLNISQDEIANIKNTCSNFFTYRPIFNISSKQFFKKIDQKMVY